MSSSAGASGSSGMTGGPPSAERRPSYWCHECQARTTARAESQELCCVTCGSGFIEEMSDDRADDDDMFVDDDDDFEGQMMQLDPIIETLLSAALQPPRASGSAGSRQTSGWTRRRRSRGQIGGAGGARPQVVMGDQFLQMLLSNLGGVHFGAEGRVGGFVPVLPLYGNPGDYAWGRGGLDAVVTNLLNQMEGAGPPPMPTDNIVQIPKVKITPSQVEAKLQCSVCWDDFSEGEEVRKLVCDHIFHDNCIVPWLQLHATCPVCRKALHEPEEDEGRSSSGQAVSANDLFGPILGAAAAAAASSSTSTSSAQSSSSASAGSRGPSTATAPEAAGSLGSTISTVLNQFFGLHSPSSSGSSSTTTSSSSSTSVGSNSSTSTAPGAPPGSGSSDQTNRRPNNDRNNSFRDMDLE